MSLLDNPPHTVEVQARELLRTSRGASEYGPVGDRVTIPCSVQPVREWSTAEENRLHGIQMLDLRQLRARDWPFNNMALIYYENDEYETVGDPQTFSKSPRTRHSQVTIRRRRKEGDSG